MYFSSITSPSKSDEETKKEETSEMSIKPMVSDAVYDHHDSISD